MKKASALLFVFLLLFSFSSCKENGKTPAETTRNEITENHSSSEFFTEEPSSETVILSTSETSTDIVKDTVEAESTTIKTPSDWTAEEIVGFYKKAAEKTHPAAKSHQVMVLDELIINDGDGALGFFIKILEPAIRAVVKNNAFDFDGITGGFVNLTAEDTKNIKAYKSGKNTVIEMTMKEQTDPIHANEYEGTVGHAISVLGDISKVLAEFPQFKVDVENADIKIRYVDATVKVVINENGVIEKGTWQYTCDPEIRHIDISGIMIDKADAKIDYIITVGGGF